MKSIDPSATAVAEPLPLRRPPAAPLFAAVLLFAGGIVLAQYVYKPAALYFLCVLGFMLCAVLALRFGRGGRAAIAYAAAVLAFFPAGALLTAAAQSLPVAPATLGRYAEGDEVVLTGYVARSGSLRSGRDVNESLDMAVEQAQCAGEPVHPVTGTVRLLLYVPGSRPHIAWETEEDSQEESVAPPLFDYGQRLRLRAKLRPPTNYRNPGNMDYVGWLRTQGVALLGSAPTTGIELLPGEGGSRFERLRWRARRSVLARMERLWPAPYAGLFQAMVLGERGMVERGRKLEFQRSGTFHLLVVSGMNVAIFAVFLLWLAKRLRLPMEYGIVAALLLTLGYAWLTELGTPILRSLLMIFAYQLTALLYRNRAPLNTVALAALLLLACDPQTLFEASFQLTFLAVLTLAGLVVPLFARSTHPVREALQDADDLRRDLSLRPRQAQFRLDLRDAAAPLARLLGERGAVRLAAFGCGVALSAVELAMLSLVMQMAITLPTVWYFHRVNPHALWANMAVLPLMSLLMPAALLAVAASCIAGWLAAPFALAARLAMQGIMATVHGSGGVQLNDVRVPMPSAMAVAVLVAAYLLALLMARRNRWAAVGSLAVLGMAAWMVTVLPRPFVHRADAVEITAIDIGQGDSFLIVTPGGRTLLLDSGGLLGMSHSELDIGEDVVSPYLWQRGLGRLDAVAFSHSHSDHMGGMAAVMRNFHPREMWYGPNYPSHEVTALLAAADRLQVRRTERHAGDSFDFDGLRFEVLSPPVDWQLKPRGQDDSSMVLRLSYAGHSALLIGDIHQRVERRIVEDAAAKGKTLGADLLKVAHHGSNTSSCAEFLDAVHPGYAVISSGVRNPFHHPRPEVVARLAEHHAQTYRTDLFGPVTFYLDAGGVHPWVAR